MTYVKVAARGAFFLTGMVQSVGNLPLIQIKPASAVDWLDEAFSVGQVGSAAISVPLNEGAPPCYQSFGMATELRWMSAYPIHNPVRSSRSLTKGLQCT